MEDVVAIKNGTLTPLEALIPYNTCHVTSPCKEFSCLHHINWLVFVGIEENFSVIIILHGVVFVCLFVFSGCYLGPVIQNNCKEFDSNKGFIGGVVRKYEEGVVQRWGEISEERVMKIVKRG